MAASNPSSGFSGISLSSDNVPDHSVIAAIDLGTSSSGYAFGFRDKESDDVKLSNIQLHKWQIGSASSSTDKAPTTVLLKPDKTFDSFGYKAECKYAQLCDQRKQMGWWYFQKFKMMLYKEKLSREVMLHDAEGKAMPAKYVFSIAIGHLKDCVLENIKRQNPSTKDEDIMYVLTVPAIWSGAAKQFMREAATESSVGIQDSHLKLVLEPEAASVFCRQRKSRFVRETDGTSWLDSLQIGHKYIILDLGGGTADIATHETIENGKLHEIDYARGDDLGGQLFNESFIQFLKDLFGEDMFWKWKLSNHADFLQLQRAIEGIKREIEDTQECDNDIIFQMPYSLVEHVQNETGNSVEEKLSHSKFNREVKLVKRVKFLLKHEFVKSFFDTILTGVTHHISEICEKTGSIKTIFMVGGLSKSPYVLEYIKTRFPHYKLIVPEDPGVAVLKGAVMLGKRPQIIESRIARYSYGIGVNQKFGMGKHDDNHMFTRNGKVGCSKVFWKLIEKGRILKYGDTFKATTYISAKTSRKKQKVIHTYLYQSTCENPSYYTEPGCTKLGGIQVNPPEAGWPDKSTSEVKICVGEAEFRFYIKCSFGVEYETTLDFLAQK